MRAPAELDAYTGVIMTEMIEAVPTDAELTVDCGDLTFADSTGLRFLIKARRRQQEGGGHLKLIEVREQLRRLLEITGLLEVFDVHLEGQDPARAT